MYEYVGACMSRSFTVRLPDYLFEKMKRYREVNWSEVVRKAIEDYIQQLEESNKIETSMELLDRLASLGVSRENLEPLPYEEELRLYKFLRRLEWKRVDSSIQAQ